MAEEPLDPNQGVGLVYVLWAIILVIIGGMLGYALIAGYVVQLALGVQVGTLEWIATAIVATIAGLALYGQPRRLPHAVRLAAAFVAPPLIAAVIFGRGYLL